MDKQKPKKCLGRFETTYMRTMTAPAPSDYALRKNDHGQYTKILNKIEMNKKFQFPSSISKYKYDYCGEKYPVAGEQKSGKSRKSALNYKPSCPQYAPYHSKTQDMSLILRRLDSQPEHEHTWYKDKTDTLSMKKLGQIKDQLDNLKELFVEERSKCHNLELQLELLKGKVGDQPSLANSGGQKLSARRKEMVVADERCRQPSQASPRLNERLLKSSEAEKVLTWLKSFDEGGHAEHDRKPVQRTPRRNWEERGRGSSGPQQLREKVIREWIGLQQGDKETVSDYSDRFWKLRLEMQAVQPMSHEEQLRRYIAGLKPKLRNEVIALRPASLADAIALAERAEARGNVTGRKIRSVKVKAKKPSKKGTKLFEPKRKAGHFEFLTPAEQFQYLSMHSPCSCRGNKEELAA